MMSEKKPQGKNVPWVEKYRPTKVKDIAQQDEVVSALQSSLLSGSLPHLLFYGQAGTGKTSTILAIARELFGNDYKASGRVLELNASDERGIGVVRKKVKTFAQGSLSMNSKMPAFKLIILDEADSMTQDAQSALRRMIENYSKVTRFCLICNYVSRIIEPVASRCAKFRFQPLEKDAMLKRLAFVADQEHIQTDECVFHTILDHSDGDMRKAINLLQSSYQLNGNAITPASIKDITGIVPETVLDELWRVIKQNNYNALMREIDQLTASGYSVLTLLHQFCQVIVATSELSDTKKSKIAIEIANADKCLVDGASEYLQLLRIASFVMQTWHQS